MNARKLGLGALALVVILVASWFVPIRQAWQHYMGTETTLKGVQIPPVQPAMRPAPVASAPAPAAPAPAPQAAAETLSYTVKPGETLYGRFGRATGAKVCELNKKLGTIQDCNRIRAGQVIQVPENVAGTALAQVKTASKPQAKKLSKLHPVVTQSVPALAQGGEILYRTVGRAPLRECGKKDVDVINEEAWVALGLSEEDKAYLRQHIGRTGPRINITSEEGLVRIEPGVRIEQVTFCRKGQAVAVGPMRTAWEADKAVYGERFVLPSGRALVWMRNCFNWITWQPPEKSVEPPEEETPPAAPPPEEEPPTLIPEERQVPKEEPERRCPIDPKAVVGQEHEPEHSGNDAHSTFLTAALYCTWRGEQGTHGIGVGTQDSWWNGKVNLGTGRYSGNLVSFGPAYEYISDNSWTFEGKLLFGRINENFRQSDYASHREIDFVGPSLSLNLYGRRERGEKWFSETRLFAMAGWATDVRAGHTWEGKSIDDTKALSEFGGLFQAGVHQDIYDASKLTVWGRAGYFLEDPSSETANLRIGISDPKRVCGIGIGTDFDLKNGGEALGWGWWCDVAKGFNVARTEHRLNQATKEHNVSFEEDGTAMVPVPPPNR